MRIVDEKAGAPPREALDRRDVFPLVFSPLKLEIQAKDWAFRLGRRPFRNPWIGAGPENRCG